MIRYGLLCLLFFTLNTIATCQPSGKVLKEATKLSNAGHFIEAIDLLERTEMSRKKHRRQKQALLLDLFVKSRNLSEAMRIAETNAINDSKQGQALRIKLNAVCAKRDSLLHVVAGLKSFKYPYEMLIGDIFELDSTSAKALVFKANLKENKAQYAPAKHALLNAYQYGERGGGIHTRVGELAFKNKEFSIATKWFQKADENNEYVNQLTWAKAFYKQQNYQSALSHFDLYFSEDVDSSSTDAFIYADALMKTGDYSTAIALLKHVATKNPTDLVVKLALFASYLNTGNDQRANELSTHFTSDKIPDIATQIYAAELALKYDQPLIALRLLRTAEGLNKRTKRGQLILAKAYLASSDYSKAAQIAQSAYTDKPEVNFAIILITSLMELSAYEKGISIAQDAVKWFPYYADLWGIKAEIEQRAKNPEWKTSQSRAIQLGYKSIMK